MFIDRAINIDNQKKKQLWNSPPLPFRGTGDRTSLRPEDGLEPYCSSAMTLFNSWAICESSCRAWEAWCMLSAVSDTILLISSTEW